MTQEFILPTDFTKLNPRKKKQVREQYARMQKGLCMYCNEPLDGPPPERITSLPVNFPAHFFKFPVHLQHNHDNNMTEGAVHCYCNAVMWQYEGR